MQQRIKDAAVAREGRLTARLEGTALPPWPVAALVMFLCARMESVTLDQIFADIQHMFLSLSGVSQSCWLFEPKLTGSSYVHLLWQLPIFLFKMH